MIQVSLAIIHNQNSEILLQHRDGNAPTNPNKWGLWGGRLEADESPEAALVRELKEELSIIVAQDQLTPFKKYQAHHFGDEWEGYVFLLEDSGFTFELQEGDDMRFFHINTVASLDTDPIAAEILTDYTKGVSK